MATVRTRKRGKTYSYIFEAGKTASGKRKVVEKGGFASADEAYTAGVEAFTDYKHGNIGITSEKMTLKDFMQLWLERVKQDLRNNTYAGYENIVNARIIPSLGNILIQELHPAQIDSWLQELYANGLSKGYITKCRTILRMAMDYAVYPCEMINSNPCHYAKVPKNAPTNVIKRHIVEEPQFEQLVTDYPLGDTAHIPIYLMYHTGMRLGESLGLIWSDIDFKEKSITINRQLVYEKQDHFVYRIATTKTEQSKRKIFVSDELLAELQKEKDRQRSLHIINAMDSGGYVYSFSDSLEINPDLTEINLVCVSDIGRVVCRQTVIYKLRNKGLNSHSFRHTQATKLASAGVQPVTAARRLGHSKPDVTLNIYTHDSEDMQKSAASSLENNEWDTFFSS